MNWIERIECLLRPSHACVPDQVGGGGDELDNAALDSILVRLGDFKVGRGCLGLEPVPLDRVLEVDGSYKRMDSQISCTKLPFFPSDTVTYQPGESGAQTRWIPRFAWRTRVYPEFPQAKG